MAGLFLGLFIVAALAALGLALRVDGLQRREGDVVRAKQTAAEQLKEAKADAKLARKATEVAEADRASADQRSLELAAELAELKEAHAAELKRLEAAAADARKDAETLRQEAVMKARTYGEALLVANRGRAEAVNELRALRQALAVAAKQIGSADERAETAETYLEH